MGRMIFDLTDEDRDALEAIRKNRGHRSQAETMRDLIRQAASSGLPTKERQVEMKAAAADTGQSQARSSAGPVQFGTIVVGPLEPFDVPQPAPVSVPYAGDLKRKPYQKGQRR